MNDDSREVYFIEEKLNIKTEVEIKKEMESCEENLSEVVAAFDWGKFSPERQNLQVKNEIMDFSVKNEPLDFNGCEMEISDCDLKTVISPLVKQSNYTSLEYETEVPNTAGLNHELKNKTSFKRLSSNSEAGKFELSNTSNKYVTKMKKKKQHIMPSEIKKFKCSECSVKCEQHQPLTMSHKKSNVWQYFSRKSKDEAECLTCHKILKSAGGSTSGLKTHAIKVHAIDFEDETSASFCKRQRTLEQFIPKKSVVEAIAKMACKDGFSFRQIALSEFIQSNLAKNVYDKRPPTSLKGVKFSVLNYYEAKKTELTAYFSGQIKAGFRYSISLDEYTSSQNRRFMNINVHHVKKHWSLGLVSIQGSLNSKRITEVVKKRLNEFGLNLNRDIVGVTSDGASVMVKFGEENGFIHQLCLAHVIHLSVCDILYKKDQLEEDTEEETATEEEEENTQEIIEDWDDYDTPLDTAFESAETNDDHISIPDIHRSFGEIISKVRKICKIFRKSPLKNDYLQEIIKADSKGKELKLVLDTPTRWNSMIAMISRFRELKNCIPRALRVCGVAEVITDDEWRSLDTLLVVLRPFEIAIKGLSSKDASLLKGENSMKFILKELENHNSVLATKLKKNLIERYSSRRMNDIIGLISYLEDPEVLKRADFKEPFLLPNHKTIKRLAETTFNRLFPSDEEAERQEEESGEDDILVSDSVVSDPMLERYLNEVASKNKKPKVSPSATFDLAKELKLYEATGKRTERLEQLYRSLSTIRATSVESERAFSSAGYFVSKIRSQLSPKTLDALCFLRSYFSSAKK